MVHHCCSTLARGSLSIDENMGNTHHSTIMLNDTNGIELQPNFQNGFHSTVGLDKIFHDTCPSNSNSTTTTVTLDPIQTHPTSNNSSNNNTALSPTFNRDDVWTLLKAYLIPQLLSPSMQNGNQVVDFLNLLRLNDDQLLLNHPLITSSIKDKPTLQIVEHNFGNQAKLSELFDR